MVSAVILVLHSDPDLLAVLLRFVVNGCLCPTVGNICMDLCMIDVTDAGASIGDRVEIFGPDAPIESLAATLGTIPYEILTSVSPRIHRIYFRE